MAHASPSKLVDGRHSLFGCCVSVCITAVLWPTPGCISRPALWGVRKLVGSVGVLNTGGLGLLLDARARLTCSSFQIGKLEGASGITSHRRQGCCKLKRTAKTARSGEIRTHDVSVLRGASERTRPPGLAQNFNFESVSNKYRIDLKVVGFAHNSQRSLLSGLRCLPSSHTCARSRIGPQPQPGDAYTRFLVLTRNPAAAFPPMSAVRKPCDTDHYGV